MRILQVINGLGTGGAEKLVVDMIMALQQRGITVDLLLLNGSETPFLTHLQSMSTGKLIDLGRSSVYHPKLLFALRSHLKAYDVVHVHLFPALYWAALAALLPGTFPPLVYTEHSTHNKRRDRWLFKLIDRWLYARYRRVVAITPLVKTNLQAHLQWNADQIQVIPNGIDGKILRQAKPYSKADLGLPEDARVLLHVARFYPPKDPITLISSMMALDASVHLMLVGEGPDRAAASAHAVQCGVASRVHFLGIRTDIPQLLQSADIVVLSSQYEGLSLAAIEGMASGKPFVASDVPGIRDSVAGAGVLFTYGDANDLGQKLKRLLDDVAYRETIVAQCLARAAQYDSTQMVDRYFALYQSLL